MTAYYNLNSGRVNQLIHGSPADNIEIDNSNFNPREFDKNYIANLLLNNIFKLNFLYATFAYDCDKAEIIIDTYTNDPAKNVHKVIALKKRFIRLKQRVLDAFEELVAGKLFRRSGGTYFALPVIEELPEHRIRLPYCMINRSSLRTTEVSLSDAVRLSKMKLVFEKIEKEYLVFSRYISKNNYRRMLRIPSDIFIDYLRDIIKLYDEVIQDSEDPKYVTELNDKKTSVLSELSKMLGFDDGDPAILDSLLSGQQLI